MCVCVCLQSASGYPPKGPTPGRVSRLGVGGGACVSKWVRVPPCQPRLDSCGCLCLSLSPRWNRAPSVPCQCAIHNASKPQLPSHPGQALALAATGGGAGGRQCPQPSLSWRTLPSSACQARRFGHCSGSGLLAGVWGRGGGGGESIPFFSHRPWQRPSPRVPALWVRAQEPRSPGCGMETRPGKSGFPRADKMAEPLPPC